jgi:CrcB protein
MILQLAMVGIGGALGSIARYALTLWFKGMVSTVPAGTLASNVAGCFIIGLFTELAAQRLDVPTEYRLLVATGFCGGFTTLSSFIYEFNAMMKIRELALGCAYLAGTLVLSYAAFVAGLLLTRLVFRHVI